MLVKQQWDIFCQETREINVQRVRGYFREEHWESFRKELGIILGCSKGGDFSGVGGLLGGAGDILRRIIPANNSLLYDSTTFYQDIYVFPVI